MNNAPKPNLEDLSTKAQLFRSSIIASIGAVAIMVTIYLPAEYAIDPTGVGRVLGLTEMGEIKVQLAEEAEADRLLDEQRAQDQSSSVLDAVFGLFVGTAHAQEAQEAWQDEVTFTLEPGATAEIKMTMEAGNVVDYAWTATGGRINFDLHAHSGGESVDYERGAGFFHNSTAQLFVSQQCQAASVPFGTDAPQPAQSDAAGFSNYSCLQRKGCRREVGWN